MSAFFDNVRHIWREFFFDGAVTPRWQTHPHKRFRFLTRMIVVCLGSAAPIGMALIGSGVLRKFEDGTQQVGLQFYVVTTVLIAVWILGVIRAVGSDQRELTHYAALGSVYPANSFVFALALQAIT